MPRPIEQDASKWWTVKEASSLSGRDVRTVQRWIACGQVRVFREPGGRVLVYGPDFLPPSTLPDRKAVY